jgi:hypothetical protein
MKNGSVIYLKPAQHNTTNTQRLNFKSEGKVYIILKIPLSRIIPFL